MEIKYSIIIPHFNDEIGLKRLLQSVPPREDIQVLVIDDRSDTDKYIEICQNSGLPNIENYLNDRVKSAGTCRNIGLENSKGNYLIFADSDDFFAENAFDYIDQETNKNNDADVIYFNVSSKSEDELSKSLRHLRIRSLIFNFIENNGSYPEEKLRLTHYVPWGKVIKRELVRKNNITFDQTIIANDGVFSLKIGKSANKIAASKEVVYCVYLRKNSLTRIKDANKLRVRCEVYARYYHLLTNSEKRMINASPLPLIYMSFRYGMLEMFKTISFFRLEKVYLFKYFKFSLIKIRKIFGV